MTLSDIDRLLNQQQKPRTIEMWKALQPLRSVVSFMNTGAHPDDETTSMLAAMSLRDGVKISQACSTRGEGGQNNIGREITKDLGVVRTREMERSAKVINMTHYWLSETPEDSIFDFGFSKSGKETLDIWGEERTLERFVHIIRREKPDIICPTFLDISGQHGHHQAMTRAAFKAVLLAADPEAYPSQHEGEDLAAWQVKKLYLPAWSGAGDAYDDDVPPPPQTVSFDGTGSDPVTGIDYTQTAQYSRHFHATQGMGRWVEAGLENKWPLNLAWSADEHDGDEQSIFDDLPHTVADLAEYVDAPSMKVALADAQTAIDNAIAAWPNFDKIRLNAAEAIKQIILAQNQCPDRALAETFHRLNDKKRQLTSVLALAHNLQCRASLSKNQVSAGGDFIVSIHNTTPDLDLSISVKLPERWDGWTHEHGFQVPNMNSFNHYAYGSVGEWMFEWMGGIVPTRDSAAYQHFTLRPTLGGDLEYCETGFESPNGQITSNWKKTTSGTEYNMSIPANTSATIELEANESAQVLVNGEATNVSFQNLYSSSRAVFELGSGKYSISVS